MRYDTIEVTAIIITIMIIKLLDWWHSLHYIDSNFNQPNQPESQNVLDEEICYKAAGRKIWSLRSKKWEL